MSYLKQRQPTGAVNLNQILAAEARLNRLHRLFKTHFNVTEPSLILEPYLFLGNCISAHDTNRLTKLGIRYILNVAIRDVELCPYYSSDMRTLTIDLRDDDRENILRAFDHAFAFIDEAKRTKSRVLVHCSHGQSRSPAIVLGYLMRTYNVSLEQCLVHVVKARACVLPNDGFLKQLILYDRFLVDRRRQREEAAAAMNAVYAAPATEIAIQHHPSVVSQPTAPLTIQRSTNEPSNMTSMSSVDSSSLGQTSSVQSSTSADSIQVIPIQIPLKEPPIDKMEPVLYDQNPVAYAPVAQEIQTNVNQSKETVAVVDLRILPDELNRPVSPRKRQSALVTGIGKRSSSQGPRSHSAHSARTHITYSNRLAHPSPDHQWNVVTYYSANQRTPKEHPQTRYITEIYDKATKRFIPATC